MEDVSLVPDFVTEFGRETYRDVIAHAGVHATEAGVDAASIPNDEEKRFLYSLLEIAEHECGKGDERCSQPLGDEDVFRFLLSHYSTVSNRVDNLPTRGAEPRRGDLGIIYPVMETADIRAEIESDVVEPGPHPLTTLGYDQRASGGEDALLLVCLAPCTDRVTGAAIPEQFPLDDGVPAFTDGVDSPVDILVPVPEEVWVITSEIAPGFMTLDGWDVGASEEVQAQIGVVSTADPTGSRALLDKILGDGDEWPDGG